MGERCLVTGAAGFIGSHLAEQLLAEGRSVVGVDSFTDYYARVLKQRNLAGLLTASGFEFIEANLLKIDLAELLRSRRIQWIFHQAGQAGVRGSFGSNFDEYVDNNVRATQQLLEAALRHPVRKFVNASSSSIYGDALALPTSEDNLPQPISPYGVTKLAAERLALVYWRNFSVPTISLRYFTVYGPRQRPDMAFHRFILAALEGRPVMLFGDGEQSRDFTYISDIIRANLQAMECSESGIVLNIGGGGRHSVREVLQLLGAQVGRSLEVQSAPRPPGDALHTAADISLARRVLGYAPKVSLPEGLSRQVEFMRETPEDRK